MSGYGDDTSHSRVGSYPDTSLFISDGSSHFWSSVEESPGKLLQREIAMNLTNGSSVQQQQFLSRPQIQTATNTRKPTQHQERHQSGADTAFQNYEMFTVSKPKSAPVGARRRAHRLPVRYRAASMTPSGRLLKTNCSEIPNTARIMSARHNVGNGIRVMLISEDDDAASRSLAYAFQRRGCSVRRIRSLENGLIVLRETNMNRLKSTIHRRDSFLNVPFQIILVRTFMDENKDATKSCNEYIPYEARPDRMVKASMNKFQSDILPSMRVRNVAHVHSLVGPIATEEIRMCKKEDVNVVEPSGIDRSRDGDAGLLSFIETIRTEFKEEISVIACGTDFSVVRNNPLNARYCSLFSRIELTFFFRPC